MKAETQEILDAVDIINYELPENCAYYLEYTDNTWAQYIKFADHIIWSSEDEEREWIEESKEEHEDGSGRWRIIPAHYEDMEPFLRKKINELISNLSKIKL